MHRRVNGSVVNAIRSNIHNNNHDNNNRCYTYKAVSNVIRASSILHYSSAVGNTQSSAGLFRSDSFVRQPSRKVRNISEFYNMLEVLGKGSVSFIIIFVLLCLCPVLLKSELIFASHQSINLKETERKREGT